MIHYLSDLGILKIKVYYYQVGGFLVSLSFCLWVLRIYSPAITCIEQCIVVNIEDVLLKLAYKNLKATTVTGY